MIHTGGYRICSAIQSNTKINDPFFRIVPFSFNSQRNEGEVNMVNYSDINNSDCTLSASELVKKMKVNLCNQAPEEVCSSPTFFFLQYSFNSMYAMLHVSGGMDQSKPALHTSSKFRAWRGVDMATSCPVHECSVESLKK